MVNTDDCRGIWVTLPGMMLAVSHGCQQDSCLWEPHLSPEYSTLPFSPYSFLISSHRIFFQEWITHCTNNIFQKSWHFLWINNNIIIQLKLLETLHLLTSYIQICIYVSTMHAWVVGNTQLGLRHNALEAHNSGPVLQLLLWLLA